MQVIEPGRSRRRGGQLACLAFVVVLTLAWLVVVAATALVWRWVS